MSSITMSVSEEFRNKLRSFPWVNWSEIAKEEATKKEMFERYLKVRKLTKDDEAFCESIDWHPVDELPIKEEYILKLKKISKGRHHATSLKQLDELMGL